MIVSVFYSELTTSPVNIRAHFPSYSNINPIFFKFILKKQCSFFVRPTEILLPHRIDRNEIDMAITVL